MTESGEPSWVGVRIHADSKWQPSADQQFEKGHWDDQVSLSLYIDGKVIDLNRIPLPADTPIIDERFTEDHAR